MKILVTGGTGLVGYSLQKLTKQVNQQINEENNNTFIFWSSRDCNLLDFDETLTKMEEIQPNVVIHLAANVGGLYKNMKRNETMFSDNLLINFNVIESCKICNVELVLSCLSTCIFPDKVNYPITEDQLHNGPPHYSNNGYAYAKRFLDIYTQLLNISDNYNNTYVNFIPTNIYGENDNYNLQDAHVIPALIHNAYISKQSNTKFIVKGTGSPLRMFIHSDDFAKIILDFIDFYSIDKLARLKTEFPISREKQNNYNFIISGNESDEVTIKYVAEKVAQYTCIESENIVFDSSFADGQYRKPVSNAFLRNLYDLYGRSLELSDFDVKIRETVEYFRNNYKDVRRW